MTEKLANIRRLLSLAFPAFIALGCGYLARYKYGSFPTEVHDHDEDREKSKPRIGYVADEDYNDGIRTGNRYDLNIHGQLVSFLKEGQEKTILSARGKKAIHRHNGHSTSGPHEISYEYK